MIQNPRRAWSEQQVAPEGEGAGTSSAARFTNKESLMRRLLLGPLAVLVLVLGLALAPPTTRAADLAYAGTWKITVLDQVNRQPRTTCPMRLDFSGALVGADRS